MESQTDSNIDNGSNCPFVLVLVLVLLTHLQPGSRFLTLGDPSTLPLIPCEVQRNLDSVVFKRNGVMWSARVPFVFILHPATPHTSQGVLCCRMPTTSQVCVWGVTELAAEPRNLSSASLANKL